MLGVSVLVLSPFYRIEGDWMPSFSQNRLELTLSMLCRRCGRKMILMADKLEAQMNGGLCRDCAKSEPRRVGGHLYVE